MAPGAVIALSRGQKSCSQAAGRGHVAGVLVDYKVFGAAQRAREVVKVVLARGSSRGLQFRWRWQTGPAEPGPPDLDASSTA